jgi:hypothetical protein
MLEKYEWRQYPSPKAIISFLMLSGPFNLTGADFGFLTNMYIYTGKTAEWERPLVYVVRALV